ncbi:MAG: hypothetical protein FWF73_07970 [Spirochaetes bacterium]|nr:hypothetical protein [Spirochaetota bacterium]
MKKIRNASLAILIVLVFISCKTKSYDKEMMASEELFYNGQYLEAARLLLPNVNKAGKDEFLFMMECGLMLHSGGDYETSNKVLLKAGKLAKIIPISITQQVASFLTNDTNTNYRGEDFEKVLVHMYLGINFLMLGKYDDARVEFLSVNNELSKIKSEDGKALYKQNIMAKYLTAIAFEMVGEKDNDLKDIEFAYVEYKQVYALDSKLDIVKDDLLRVSKRLGYDDDYNEWKRTFGRSYNEDSDTGELITIFQAGRSAIKKSRGPILEDKTMANALRATINSASLAQGITISTVLVTLNQAENPIPKFEKRSNKVNKMRIESGGKAINTIILENVEKTAIQNLEDSYSKLYLKLAASIATKAIASLAAGLAAEAVAKQFQATKGFASLIGTVAGGGTAVALFSQMKPDLRCWHTLPANFQLGRMMLKPGTQTVNFVLIGNNGAVERIEKTVEIKKGQKTLVNMRTLY